VVFSGAIFGQQVSLKKAPQEMARTTHTKAAYPSHRIDPAAQTLELPMAVQLNNPLPNSDEQISNLLSYVKLKPVMTSSPFLNLIPVYPFSPYS
jgi:hypothetical protein